MPRNDRNDEEVGRVGSGMFRKERRSTDAKNITYTRTGMGTEAMRIDEDLQLTRQKADPQRLYKKHLEQKHGSTENMMSRT